jgi:hypothetical protein
MHCRAAVGAVTPGASLIGSVLRPICPRLTLKTEINEMIRHSDINDPYNTEMHRDVWIIVVILYQFRIISFGY